MDSERQSFLTAIRQNPCDGDLRLIFSDWLEEHGMPEEAQQQRDWKATSRKWMVEFAKKHHQYGKYHDWEKEECEGHGPDWPEIETTTDEIKEEYYNEFMEFLGGHVEGEGAFGFDIPYNFKEYSDEMWYHYEALTGEKPPDEYRTKMPENFRCAC